MKKDWKEELQESGISDNAGTYRKHTGSGPEWVDLTGFVKRVKKLLAQQEAENKKQMREAIEEAWDEAFRYMNDYVTGKLVRTEKRNRQDVLFKKYNVEEEKK